MNLLTLIDAQSNSRKLILSAALFAGALLLFRFEDALQMKIGAAKKEYAVDRELSANQDQYRQKYEQILSQSSQLSFQPMEQNEWIRSTQDLAGRHQLLLQELTPVPRKGSRVNDLSLVMVGSTENVAGFLREISTNADGVSASRLIFSRQADGNLIEAQIQLTQG